jgi:hypothetical protein
MTKLTLTVGGSRVLGDRGRIAPAVYSGNDGDQGKSLFKIWSHRLFPGSRQMLRKAKVET